MQKTQSKNIIKLIGVLKPINWLLIFAPILFCLSLITKAETVDLVSNCVDQKCFSNISNVVTSRDGSFALVVDSQVSPYIRKIDFSSGVVTGNTVISLNENNENKASLKIGISGDNKKALVLRSSFKKPPLTGSSSSSSGGDFFGRLDYVKEAHLLHQETACNCPISTIFDGTTCVPGTLDCSNETSDPVCGCDNLNYLNSCVAKVNRIKTFTKGECAAISNLACSSDSQCPLGTCPDGITTYSKFTCALSMCTGIVFSNDPCLATPSTDCKCASGTFFDGTNCVSSGAPSCTNEEDPVCSCDNLNFLNSCVARANGVKKFTKGGCAADDNINCNNDSQCPLGECSNDKTYARFTCTNGKCKKVVFSSDPCLALPSTDCKCATDTFFDGTNCVSGTAPSCAGTVQDLVCSCDNLNFLNSCIARVNGVKKFTKGGCGADGGISCISDSQCPAGTCPNGVKYKRFACVSGECQNIEFSVDPCSAFTEDVDLGSGSLIHIIDLKTNAQNTITPVLKNDLEADISAVSFLDPEGKQLIASTSDEDSPRLLVIDSTTGATENDLSIPGVAKSIELSPNSEKAVVTFKDALAQTLGILNTRTKVITRLDTPQSIVFKIDEFLSMVDFNLSGTKAVVSSLGGRHVFHLLDLKTNHLSIRFLGKDVEGSTLSTISSDGAISVAVSNDETNNRLVIYKLNTVKARLPRVVQTVTIDDNSTVLDVLITPDNNKVLILVLKENQKRLKVLALNDLSQICEFTVSSDLENSFLVSDPLGTYLLTLNFKDNSVNLISEIGVGPVFRNISPAKTSKSGLATAKLLADADIETIVLEKSAQGSAGNFFSGIINKDAYKSIFGEIDMPIERSISEYRAYLLTEDTSTCINHRNKKEDSFSIIRNPFNNYISRITESKGVSVLYKKVVRELIIKDGKVCGIKTDDEEFYSKIVIIAEGVNSLLTKQSGLKVGDFIPREVFLFVEENISFSSELIEERFNLEKGQGIAAKFFTASLFKAPSISFIHTNKNSISLSTGVLLSKSIAQEININQYHERLKQHQAIKPIILDGAITNYNSFIIPAPISTVRQRIYANGCLIVGGAAMMVNLFNWDLSSLALYSAKCAAETVIMAKKLNDYSEKTLSPYKRALSSFMKEQNNPTMLLENEKDNMLENKVLNNLSSLLKVT